HGDNGGPTSGVENDDARGRRGGHFACKVAAWNLPKTMSGAERLWRDGKCRPTHNSVALAPGKPITSASCQLAPRFLRQATRAASFIVCIANIDRSEAKGSPSGIASL